MPARFSVPAAAAWLLMLILAIVLSVLAAKHGTLPGDLGIAHWAQDLPFPGKILSDLVRTVTATEVVLATGFAIALVLWLRGYHRQAVVLGIGLLSMVILEVGLKYLVDRPRPDPSLVHVRAEADGSSSFPSGHVMAGSFLYGMLLYFALTLAIARLARWLLAATSLFFLVLVGPASVYLGVHWPSDILGSWSWVLVLIAPLFAADRILASS